MTNNFSSSSGTPTIGNLKPATGMTNDGSSHRKPPLKMMKKEYESNHDDGKKTADFKNQMVKYKSIIKDGTEYAGKIIKENGIAMFNMLVRDKE